MIRIAKITLREIELPLLESFRTSHGVVEARRILLLELMDADGYSVWSECVAQAEAGYSSETVDSCWDAIAGTLAARAMTEAVVPGRMAESGQPVVPGRMAAPARAAGAAGDSAPAIHDALMPYARDARMARAAIEMGVWALVATREALPLAVLLARTSSGGRTGGVSPSSQVETGVALGMESSPEAVAVRAVAAMAEGYRRIKLKVVPETAVEHVAAARAALGAQANLSVDANGSFSAAEPSHLAVLEALDGFGLTMIEQPLPPDDLRASSELQRRLSTRICLDESITGVERAEEMLALGSGRVVNLKPGRVGGFTQALAIHDLCMRSSVPLWCGGMFECGIGRAYNVALASLSGFTEPGDLSPSSRYWARDVVVPPWTMDGTGLVRVPLDRAGIGVEVDEGFIDELTVRAAVVSAR